MAQAISFPGTDTTNPSVGTVSVDVTNRAAHADVTNIVLLSGEDQTNNVMVVETGRFEYEVVPVTTQTTLGTAGGAGDYLHKILAENATTSIAIHDGAVLVYTWTITAATEPNELELNCVCLTNWKLTCTGAGATAIGRFS